MRARSGLRRAVSAARRSPSARGERARPPSPGPRDPSRGRRRHRSRPRPRSRRAPPSSAGSSVGPDAADGRNADAEPEVEEILRVAHHGRAVADQVVRKLGESGRDRARDRAHVASQALGLLRRVPGARAMPPLHDHDQPGERGHDPVALREEARLRRAAGLLLGDDRAAPRGSGGRARAFEGGYGMSGPLPSTATVAPPAASAPSCAAESQPSAMPLTTTMPAAAAP